MYQTVDIETALQFSNPIFIDVRSPAEFTTGCIPGAINIPLFTNEERVDVGTLYKREGSEKAKQLGLSVVSPRLPDIIAQIQALHKKEQPLIIYCWRGGMRSKSIVSVLEVMGLSALQLTGGYKSFRQYSLNQLLNYELKSDIIVLCGSTGVGKTALLSLLAQKDIPVINLEQLANHKGSAFGHIGTGFSTTAQNFDVAILKALDAYNDSSYIVVECESKRIGNVYIPDVLYKGMQHGRRILVTASFEIRVERLLAEYNAVHPEHQALIIKGIQTLEKKLGSKNIKMLIEQMMTGQFDNVVRTLLTNYYDPLYGYEKQPAESDYDLVVSSDSLPEACSRIIEYLNK